MEAEGANSQLPRFSALQSAHADPAHARDANLLEIDIVSKLQGTEPDLLSGLVPLAYGRLAMAEEELGDPQAAPKAFDDARHALPKPFGNHSAMNDEEIKQWVRRADKSFQNFP